MRHIRGFGSIFGGHQKSGHEQKSRSPDPLGPTPGGPTKIFEKKKSRPFLKLRGDFPSETVVRAKFADGFSQKSFFQKITFFDPDTPTDPSIGAQKVSVPTAFLLGGEMARFL